MDDRAVTYNNLNLSDPEALFAHLHNVCIEDGNIEELRSCLHSLVLIPREFSHVWETAKMALDKTARFVNDELDKFADDPTGDQATQKCDDYYQYLIDHVEARNSDLDPATKLREAEKQLEELQMLRKEYGQAERDIQQRNDKIEELEEEGEELKEEVEMLRLAIEKYETDQLNLREENEEWQRKFRTTKESLEKFKQETEISAKKKLEDLQSRDRMLKRRGTELEILKKELDQAKLTLEREREVSSSRSISMSMSPRVASPPAKEVEPELPPELMKYWRMLKNRVPKNAVLNRMTQDKVDHSHLEQIENHLNGKPKPAETLSARKSVSFQAKKTAAEKKEEAKNEIPKELKKYHMMLTKMKIPPSAVQNKMKMDGIDPARICEIDGSGGAKKMEIPEELKKYHKMLTKMKIPASAVQNKMKMDGIDPARICEIDGSGGAKKMEIPEELKKYHKMLTKMKI